jgi:hypothetical protein
MTPAEPATDALLDTPVMVRWSVEAIYRRRTTLREVLEALDPNEDAWRNEIGSVRFASVADALAWVHDEGRDSGDVGSWLGGFSDETHEYDWSCELDWVDPA